jgi:hypothetical protein
MKNDHLFRLGNEFIESMKELIKRYQTAIKLGMSKKDYEDAEGLDCLLCNPLGTKENREFHKKPRRFDFEIPCIKLGCPWMVILGMTCCDFSNSRAEGVDGFDHIYSTDNADVMKRRIKQLRNWIKMYEKHMETV